MSDEEPRIVREEIDGLRSRVVRLEELAGQLLKVAPGPVQEKARRNRLIYEICGLAIAATGAWFVYPPSAPLLVGAWMLAEIVTSRPRPRKDR